jgi:hypothetical protein
MQRFTISLLTVLIAAIQVAPTTYAATHFDELRRENLEKDASSLDELRRENLEKSGKPDFDQLRRENLEKDAVNLDELRRENLEKDAIAPEIGQQPTQL